MNGVMTRRLVSFNGLFNRLHPEGNHPGLSDEDDSTFRLHIVIIVARLLLRRYVNDPRS